MEIIKLNESYSQIVADPQTLKNIFEYLKVERNGAYFEPAVKAGFKSPYDYFGIIENNMFVVMNGHLQLLKQFNIEQEILMTDYNEKELDEYLDFIRPTLPFKPYDFQEIAFKQSILNVKQINKMCTSCLDGKTEIDIIIDDYTEEEIFKMLNE